MKLQWTLEAIRDREEIFDFIAVDNPSAALALDELIADRATALQDIPRIGRAGRVPNTFELVIQRSYMIVYDIVGARVRILNVVNTARHWPPLHSHDG